MLMRDWRSDEERARDDANAWKLELEAVLIGAGLLLIYATTFGSLF